MDVVKTFDPSRPACSLWSAVRLCTLCHQAWGGPLRIPALFSVFVLCAQWRPIEQILWVGKESTCVRDSQGILNSHVSLPFISKNSLISSWFPRPPGFNFPRVCQEWNNLYLPSLLRRVCQPFEFSLHGCFVTTALGFLESSEGRRSDPGPSSSNQERRAEYILSLPFCFIQVLRELDDAHLHWRRATDFTDCTNSNANFIQFTPRNNI